MSEDKQSTKRNGASYHAHSTRVGAKKIGNTQGYKNPHFHNNDDRQSKPIGNPHDVAKEVAAKFITIISLFDAPKKTKEDYGLVKKDGVEFTQANIKEVPEDFPKPIPSKTFTIVQLCKAVLAFLGERNTHLPLVGLCNSILQKMMHGADLRQLIYQKLEWHYNGTQPLEPYRIKTLAEIAQARVSAPASAPAVSAPVVHRLTETEEEELREAEKAKMLAEVQAKMAAVRAEFGEFDDWESAADAIVSAPVVDAPVVDAPVVDAPVSAPVVDVPVVDASVPVPVSVSVPAPVSVPVPAPVSVPVPAPVSVPVPAPVSVPVSAPLSAPMSADVLAARAQAARAIAAFQSQRFMDQQQHAQRMLQFQIPQQPAYYMQPQFPQQPAYYMQPQFPQQPAYYMLPVNYPQQAYPAYRLPY
jgi:hypothetical protein